MEGQDPRADAMLMVGYALWQLQVLEEGLATFLVLRHYATLGMGQEAAQPLVDKAEARTMGSLLRELVTKGSVDPDLGDRLAGLLAERNWLVHRSRRESRELLQDEARVSQLLLGSTGWRTRPWRSQSGWLRKWRPTC
ncbi:MAG: hypothetical protein U5R14_03280 [Gemmatimonadota bacterium]|nr:hypothetical protein [Gemmatimonadota bacterium]